MLVREVMLEEITETEEIAWSLFSKFVIGPILGTAFGIVITFQLKRVFKDPVSEIALTTIAVYLMDYVAIGSGLQSSGIMGLVFLGVTVTSWSKV
jgi:NhaP-type Na+/H+ or K+/H+ antiporter